jgi:hypothetical protein
MTAHDHMLLLLWVRVLMLLITLYTAIHGTAVLLSRVQSLDVWPHSNSQLHVYSAACGST